MSNLSNPYRFGEPVNDPAMLFGRRDALDWLERQLHNDVRTLVLSSLPFMGKTSLIKNVSAKANLEGLHFIVSLFISPNDGRDSYSAVLRSVMEQLTSQFRFMGLLSPVAPMVSSLRELFAQVQPHLTTQRVVIYWDDLHLLLDNDMAVLTGFLTSLTPLLEDYPQTHFVFTLNQDQLRRIRHPLIDRAPVFHLNALSVDSSLNMVTLPVRHVLRFDYGVTRRITEINSHHPYYLTLFCYTLFNRQVHDGWVNQRSFDAVLGEVLEATIEPFKQLWEQSSWAERAVLAGMAAMPGAHGPMTTQEIVRFLQKESPNVTANAVLASLETLAERGVLVTMGATSYRFHVELLRFWLREHADLLEVIQKVNWQAYAPPKVAPAPSPRPRPSTIGRRRFSGMVISALILLFCTVASGGALAAQIFGVSLASLMPTATPMVAVVVVGTDGQPVVNPNVVVNIPVTPSATPSPTPLPTPTPVPVQVRTLPALTYMARDVDEGWRIYTMNADGSNVVALSPVGADERGPVWSPGGQWIAYISQLDGNRDIFVMDAEGRNRVNVTQNSADDWTPAWSPDGQSLAFSSIRTGRWEIYIMDMTCLVEPATCPEKIQQITDNVNGNISPVFSPDGSRIAFNSRANGDWDIYTMSRAGSDLRQVTSSPANELAPAWSPNGEMIAYETDQDGNIEIYVVNVNGNSPRNVSNYTFANDHGPTWSPDSQQLVFYSNREGNFDIFSTTLDGKTVVNLTQTPSRDEQTPSWLP